MKRFFSRFSTAGPISPAKPASEASFDRSEKQDLAAPSPAPPLKAPYNTVGRTKALVTKFEATVPHQPIPPSLSTSNATSAPQLTIPITSLESPLSDVQLNPFDYALSSSAPRSVPSRVPGSSLPADAPIQHSKSDSVTPKDRSHSPYLAGQANDQHQASYGSQTGSSTTHTSKTVAFAPSPQKQRSTSPALQRSSMAPPLSRSSSNDSNPFAGSSNFARPTAASQARSRTWTRSAASDASQQVSLAAGSHSVRDKSSSSYARSSRVSQAASTRSSARRSYSYSSGPATRDGDPSGLASTSSLVASRTHDIPSSIRRRTSLDVAQSGRVSPIKASRAAAAASGPLQFPTRTSQPMRISYSGSNRSRPGSRRNSFNLVSPTGSNEPVVFPHSGGAAARSFAFPTWSEMTHEELVRNLGPRERTRQEVLWEIVASEERYVAELEKAKELYIDALIHPEHFDPERVLPPPLTPNTAFSTDRSGSKDWSSTPQSGVLSTGSLITNASSSKAAVATSSGDLPIAARFMSCVSAGKAAGNSIDASRREIQSQWDAQQAAGSRSPYSVGVGDPATSDYPSARNGLIPNRSDAAFGLGLGLGTTATGDRSTAAYMDVPVAAKGKARVSKAQKLRALSGKASSDADPLRLSVPLPPSLRQVLVAMSDGLVEAHGMLSDALKARYEEQWPLVRSLADVFMKYSHILEHYASYVCHLQRAMEEVEEAALMERAFRGKRLKKERLSNTVGLGRTVAALEACAAEQGYAGLSIFASMPFQRLLKYPLLFQNLLFHTDPSTHEFESTVAMVVEIERLVRSIEDEKVNAEERDKTRDVFARIDGITDRQVLRPRPDRTLIEEKALYDEHARRTLSESAPKDGRGETYASDSEGGESGPEGGSQQGGRWSSSNQSGLRAALRNKRSYRRLSDLLSSEERGGGSSKAPALGSKKDLWVVRFSDVEIKCQRIGVTALPMVSTAALRDEGAAAEIDTSDFTARSKDSRGRLKALRNTTLRAKTRNLYKFVSVVAWRNAASRQAEGGKGGFADGLPLSYEGIEEDDEEDDDDGASVSSADSSSASSSSSGSGSSDGVDGQAGKEKYVRSTKLSFTYWGDRIEPGRTIAGVRANGGGNTQVKIAANKSARRTNGVSTGSVSRSAQRPAAASTDSAVTAGSAPTTESLRASRQARYSTPGGRPPSTVRSTGKVSGRLGEPLSATSMSTAPESMQTAVAQMHARQRNVKFGGRLRSSITPMTAAPVGGESNASHVSVNLVGSGDASRRGSTAAN
ncbi:uncharacterized protein UBRO_03778 [Ustilago bromivora]|uniref:DH domain-containing protein n=1 Tax=Ustilago bromivora TaxID=307758 RepID=A0A1K0FVT3_9BASI|nr:uncharacterized protein UBRO_03778 [Ustilago bromivora]SYW83124.1 uncharacterized protein UBRO2_05051 [Ustilago bromivora]